MQNYVEASRYFLEQQWYHVCEWFNHDQYMVRFCGSVILFHFTFWGLGLLYTFLDFTGKPSFLTKYKIQKTSFPVTWDQLRSTVALVFFNMTVVFLLIIVLLYQLYEWRGWNKSPHLPPYSRIISDLLLCSLIEDVFLYYNHRLLHHPFFYKRFHKLHHQWTAPIAISVFHCHPVEMILSNLFPVVVGPLLLDSHTFTSWIWYSMAIISGLYSHSGYRFPFLISPEYHDEHHSKVKYNFGAIGIMDWIHGTYKLPVKVQ